MNREDLVDYLVKNSEIEMSRADAKRIVSTILQGFLVSLQLHKSLKLSGYLSIFVKDREARMGRNPRTGEPVEVPPRKTIRFKAGAKMKALFRKGTQKNGKKIGKKKGKKAKA